MVELDNRVVGPEFLPDRLTGYDLTRTFQQHLEDLEGLFLEPDAVSVFVQFARFEVQPERARNQRRSQTAQLP